MISQLPPQVASSCHRTAYTNAYLSMFSTYMHINYLKYFNILLLYSSNYHSHWHFHTSPNLRLAIGDLYKSCAAFFYEKARLVAHPTDIRLPRLGRFRVHRISFIQRCSYLPLLCRINHTPFISSTSLYQSKPKNRPFHNPSRGRSIRQGGRMGDNYKEIPKCH